METKKYKLIAFSSEPAKSKNCLLLPIIREQFVESFLSVVVATNNKKYVCRMLTADECEWFNAQKNKNLSVDTLYMRPDMPYIITKSGSMVTANKKWFQDYMNSFGIKVCSEKEFGKKFTVNEFNELMKSIVKSF